MAFMTDPVARDMAFRKWGLPECLHVPIAAIDENAIRTYVGDILEELGRGSPPRALLVRAKEPPPPDRSLPIWHLEGSKTFHEPLQVWVDVAYTRYRPAYRKAFPTEDIADRILSHTMNRRTAALK